LLIALQYTHPQANYLPVPNLGLAVFLGNGDGTFTPETGGPFVLAGPYGPFLAGQYSWGLAVGDFNRDGAPDVAVLNNDANNILSYVTVLLNSTAPVSASPDSITYAARTEGTVSPAQTVVFTNNGSAPLAIGTIALGGADPGDFSFASACGTSLLAGANCTISVKFDPKAKRTRTATLAIPYGPSSQASVQLSGVGR
jgi:hypothetical protein